jgi:hypothetical protein
MPSSSTNTEYFLFFLKDLKGVYNSIFNILVDNKIGVIKVVLGVSNIK